MCVEVDNKFTSEFPILISPRSHSHVFRKFKIQFNVMFLTFMHV